MWFGPFLISASAFQAHFPHSLRMSSWVRCSLAENNSKIYFYVKADLCLSPVEMKSHRRDMNKIELKMLAKDFGNGRRFFPLSFVLRLQNVKTGNCSTLRCTIQNFLPNFHSFSHFGLLLFLLPLQLVLN